MIRIRPPARRLRASLAALFADRRGATVVEYGLICAMIVLVMLVSLRAVASGTITLWTSVSNNIVGR